MEQFYHPDGWGGAELPLDLTTALARAGFAVEVMCGSEAYAPLEGPPPPDPTQDGVLIHRVAAGRGAGRLRRQLRFCAALVPLLLRRPPDLFVAQTNPPLAIVLLALASALRRRPLLLIAMDIYPEVMIAHGMLRAGGLPARVLRAAFSWAYRRAARVVSLGPKMSERLREKGVQPERIVEIPTWATGSLRPPPADNPLRAAWGLEGRFVVLYSGNLGIAHEFETLLEAVRLAAPRLPSLRLVIIGRGSRLAGTRARAQALGLDAWVRFEEPLPAARLPESFGLAALAVVTLQPGFEGLVTPSKLQGYLARGLPVLYIGPPGDVDCFIARGGCGVAVANGDAQRAADALVALGSDPARRAELARRARESYLAQFDRAHALEGYRSLIRELLAGREGAVP